MAAKLKKKYFVSKVEQLHSSDPGKWWSKTPCILNLDNSNPLANLDYQAVTAAIRLQSRLRADCRRHCRGHFLTPDLPPTCPRTCRGHDGVMSADMTASLPPD